MLAYCNNNPVMHVDYSGNLATMNTPGKNRIYINDEAAKPPFLIIENKNFKFQDNPNYNFWNAMEYAVYLKKYYYADKINLDPDETRLSMILSGADYFINKIF